MEGQEEVERAPYGLSMTRRSVSNGGESALFRPYDIEGNGTVELVDYMGSDDAIERVATAGHGREIFPEGPSQEELFDHLVQQGIRQPFKFGQVKYKVQGPIAMALHPVYFQPGSTNEYSGRYSDMLDSGFVPSVEQIAWKLDGEDKETRAQQIHELLLNSRGNAQENYRVLLDSGLTRELARGGLGTNNDTQFFWKVDLESLSRFVDNLQSRDGFEESIYGPYVKAMAEIAYDVFPEAWGSLFEAQNQKYVHLTMPRDSDVVDGPLAGPSWEPRETRRIVVPGMEERLFDRKVLLGNSEFQVIDYMGDDDSLAEAARVSYGRGTKKSQGNKGLVRSLVRDEHTSPIEMAEMAVEFKAPVFTDPRQFGRHRTLDFHGFMGYNPIGDELYMPVEDEFRSQDTKNRQGRAGLLNDESRAEVAATFKDSLETELENARMMRWLGAPEEDIRASKGVFFLTRTSRTGDLHNWAHFLRLRLDPHAQKEIREAAGMVADAYDAFPGTSKAQRDYRIDAVKLSVPEQAIVTEMARRGLLVPGEKDFEQLVRMVGADLDDERRWYNANKEEFTREGKGFVWKLNKLFG